MCERPRPLAPYHPGHHRGRLITPPRSPPSPVAAAQADSESYIVEIEATGAAFEEMQGQNARLLAQITAREEAHASLTTERLKVRPTPWVYALNPGTRAAPHARLGSFQIKLLLFVGGE